MKKLTEKLSEKFLDLSFDKAIAFFALLTGISVTSIYKLTKEIFKASFTFTASEILAFFVGLSFLILFVVYLIKKLQSKRMFEEGTKVILSTNTLPVMSAGNYNFWNNKILCSWPHNGEIKERWIYQKQLIEYERPQKTFVRKNSGFWQRDRY